MKATTIFGGVQLFQIVLSIIKSKLVAILIGPSGMGIYGLLTTATSFITSLTNFGLSSSAVKNIAEANSSGNQEEVNLVSTILMRLVWITGLFGTIVTLCLSPLLSRLTFGNNDYTISFVWLSITLLITQLSVGQVVVIQGLRRLKYLAITNLIGAIVGLLIAIPFYYVMGIRGIVPVIIVTAIATLLVSSYFYRKLSIKQVHTDKELFIKKSKSMLKMGFLINISGILAILVAYILRMIIVREGGLADVGLYNAGFVILNTYVGMITAAIATDYYPRLAEVAKDSFLLSKTVNQQAEVAILLLAPILCVFIIFIKFILIILYSNDFIAISQMVQWSAIGVLFRTISWAISYIFLAKADSTTFFMNELFSQIYFLPLQICGYYMFGLDGLGMAFLISYIIYFLQVYLICRKKYEFKCSNHLIKIFLIQLFLSTLCFGIIMSNIGFLSYILGGIIIISSTAYSIFHLQKKMNLKSLILNKLGR